MSDKKAKRVKILKAISSRYEKDGTQKNQYFKIGVEVTETLADGSEHTYLLINRFINFAGFPNYSGKDDSTSILVLKFDPPEDGKEDSCTAMGGEVF